MNAYVPLLHLCARHAYFGEQALARFRFAPSPATAALLLRHDILIRLSTEGLTLVCPESVRAALQAGAEPALELEFEAWTVGVSFSLVTAPEAPTPDARLMFHSSGAVREDGGSWRLHAAPQADASAWSRTVIPNRTAAHATGRLRAAMPAFHMVLAAPALAEALAAQTTQATQTTPRFLVRFGARATRWKYYLLGDRSSGDADDGADTAIVDLDGVLSFRQRGYTEMPGRRAALTFVSEQAIEMRQHPLQRLQLCERGESGRPVKRILIKRLPNASVAAVGREVAPGSNVEGASGDAVLVSEIYIR